MMMKKYNDDDSSDKDNDAGDDDEDVLCMSSGIFSKMLKELDCKNWDQDSPSS